MKTILAFQLLLLFALANTDAMFAQWQSIGPFGSSYNTILKFDPFSPGRLFASGGRYLFRSDDEGNAWWNITPPTGPMEGEYGLAISKSIPGEIYAVSEKNIYKSANYGDSWTPFYSDSSRTIVFLNELESEPLAHLCKPWRGIWWIVCTDNNAIN